MSRNESDITRVKFGDVEFDDDLALLDGQPFTGILYAHYPEGELETERRYREGLPEGPSEIWYPDGQLLHRWIAVWGQGSSESWEWHPNAQLRAYRRNMDGWAVELRNWDEEGRLIRDERQEPPTASPD